MAFNKSEGKKVCSFVLPILFAPDGSRPLTESYPELNEVPIFRKIGTKDLKFVWYYTVLYNKIQPDRERVLMSISESYGTAISDEDKNRLVGGNWSADMREAVDKMASYDLSPRLKIKKMVEQIFDEYQTILTTGCGTDIEEKQKYVALTKNIIDIMPQILKSIETNLGVSEISTDFYVDNANLTDGYYKHKKAMGDEKQVSTS